MRPTLPLRNSGAGEILCAQDGHSDCSRFAMIGSMQAPNPFKPDSSKTDVMPSSRELTGSQILLTWVKDAVEHIDWPNKAGDFQGHSARSFLVLEVYCCAKGAVGAEEVADWLDVDPVLHAEFPQSRPSPPLIMAFRKCHRHAIQQCLSRVLDLALKARFGDEGEHLTPLDYCVVRGLDAWFNPRCGPNPEEEAVQRLNIQAWTDKMSLD